MKQQKYNLFFLRQLKETLQHKETLNEAIFSLTKGHTLSDFSKDCHADLKRYLGRQALNLTFSDDIDCVKLYAALYFAYEKIHQYLDMNHLELDNNTIDNLYQTFLEKALAPILDVENKDDPLPTILDNLDVEIKYLRARTQLSTTLSSFWTTRTVVTAVIGTALATAGYIMFPNV